MFQSPSTQQILGDLDEVVQFYRRAEIGISKVDNILRRAIEDKLMVDRSLKGLMKLRVGDYRVIYSIKRETVTVHVIKIGHRKDVYDK